MSKKKENTNKTYLYCARSKPQQKPTSSANKYNNNDYNKNRNFSATFKPLCPQLFGNSSPDLWLSNGSWTWHCIFWKLNLVLYYNNRQFRLIKKNTAYSFIFEPLLLLKKKKKTKTKNNNKKHVWIATYSFIKHSVNMCLTFRVKRPQT